MISGLTVLLLLIAGVAMAWFGFEVTKTQGGLVSWIAFGFAITLGLGALLEAWGADLSQD